MKNSQGASAGTLKALNKNDNVIIPQKEKNYIDTLYLYTNLEQHYTQKDDDYGENYKWYLVRKAYYEKYEDELVKIADAEGYEWWSMKNYRIGFMDYDKAKALNRPNCIIQYEHSHLFILDMQLTELDLPFLQDRNLYKFKRIDITKTAQLDKDYTKLHGYMSPYRGDPLHPIRYGETSQTVYLGSRKNGNVFRMYNKTIELIQSNKYDKIKAYEDYFGTIENLYTFEHELHRKYLTKELNIDTLIDLPQVWQASQNTVSKIRIFKMNDKNIKLIKQKNSSRVNAFVLSPFVEYIRPVKKKYERSIPAMVKRIEKEIQAYLECEEGKEQGDTLAFRLYVANIIFAKLMEDVAGGQEIDLEFNIRDSLRKEQIDEMLEKYEYMHKFNTKELHDEAEFRMGKYPFKKPKTA